MVSVHSNLIGDLGRMQLTHGCARSPPLVTRWRATATTDSRLGSLRALGNCRLPRLAAAGYRYDSSLATYPFAGHRGNPRVASHLSWPGGSILEFPPLAIGGTLRLPAGSWTGRLAPTGWLASAACG